MLENVSEDMKYESKYKRLVYSCQYTKKRGLTFQVKALRQRETQVWRTKGLRQRETKLWRTKALHQRETQLWRTKGLRSKR